MRSSVSHPEGMREAMFPSVKLNLGNGRGRFWLEGSAGKTYVIERASALTLETQWTAIHTEQMRLPTSATPPRIDFSDSTIGTAASAVYYRIRWQK